METNKNLVELIGTYGSDETHALSAWTSTSRDLTDEKRERIPKLLKMLVKGSDGNSHLTPFEKSSLHFLVTTDIATHIHIIKHRIAVSVNAESARYKELKDDKFYLPEDWPKYWLNILEEHTLRSQDLYHRCLESLVNDFDFDRKRAKESSRYFLGYNTQITSDVQFNFRSFMEFQKLRNKMSAQTEVRKVADEMFHLVIKEEKFKHSIDAYAEYLQGRN